MPLRLLLYPDPGLRRPAAPVETFGAPVDEAVDAIARIMREAGAIGLTAPHIGLSARIVVVRMPGAEQAVYVNPIVVSASAETAIHEEGSVSMPGVRAAIERPVSIRIGYRDRVAAAAEEEFAGFGAAILQHEIDQLDGIFWIDRLSRLKRERVVKRYKKIRRST